MCGERASAEKHTLVTTPRRTRNSSFFFKSVRMPPFEASAIFAAQTPYRFLASVQNMRVSDEFGAQETGILKA